MSAGPATAHRPTARRPVAPRGPRRVSGPAHPRPARPTRPVAPPRAPRTRGRSVPRTVADPSLAARVLAGVAALPDARWLDRLVRGRAWIAMVGVALIGLVFVQVSMLEMNAGIGQAVEKGAALERQNADLRTSVSQLSSEERIQREAVGMGLVMPPAGDVRYLTSRGAGTDAARAARIMRAPDPGLQQVAAPLAATAAPVDPAAAPADPAATPADPAATPADPAAPIQPQPPAPQQTQPQPAAPQQAPPAPQAQPVQPTGATGAAAAPAGSGH
jgi:hypothetical protein